MGGNIRDMKLLFISDLHLGSPLFQAESKLLSLLSDSYDRVFILGDILDVWEADLESIVESNKRIINKINELDNVVIVRGNHDPSIYKLSSIFNNAMVSRAYRYSVDGKIMIMIHGDECDDLIVKYSWLAKLLFPIHWVCERFGINLKGFFRTLYYSVAMKVDKKYYNDLVLDIEKDLVSKYKDKCDYLIAGHIHVPKIVEKSNITYINCGDWVYNETYIIYEDGVFKFNMLGK